MIKQWNYLWRAYEIICTNMPNKIWWVIFETPTFHTLVTVHTHFVWTCKCLCCYCMNPFSSRSSMYRLEFSLETSTEAPQRILILFSFLQNRGFESTSYFECVSTFVCVSKYWHMRDGWAQCTCGCARACAV